MTRTGCPTRRIPDRPLRICLSGCYTEGGGGRRGVRDTRGVNLGKAPSHLWALLSSRAEQNRSVGPDRRLSSSCRLCRAPSPGRVIGLVWAELR